MEGGAWFSLTTRSFEVCLLIDNCIAHLSDRKLYIASFHNLFVCLCVYARARVCYTLHLSSNIVLFY
jgi:hypothetical protein